MNNELSIEIKTYAQEATNQLNKLKQSLNQLSGDVDTNQKKIENTTNSLSKALNVVGLTAMFKQISRTFMNSINAVNEYSESLNLFNVVMGNTDDKFSELGLSATKFQNKMREAFGVQQAQTLTYQALYQSMAENMGIVSDKAGIMSENTTKLINDLSSLYNRDEKTTAEALRAGIYAGQTKPLRSFGIDVTQTSLTPILENLGIERTVNELNQAEKQILRYIAVLKQSSIAHGDWANTIESPSNQLRIFKNQLAETSVAIGSLFQGAFAKILPYANAILMVIKEVTNAIATMFGIEIEDYNSSIASTDVSDYYDDVADSVGGATKKVKELKRETLSFDQIHNINENNNKGSGIGATSGGIDQRLLDAINGYDNGLDKVNMKATQIRDKIMEWLGFTKEIDPLTGKVSFKLKEGITPIKIIGATIATILGYKIVKKVADIIPWIKKIKTALLGVDKISKDGSSQLTLLGKTLKSIKDNGISAIFEKIKTKITSLIPKVAKATAIVGGLALSFVGAKGLYSAVKQNTLALDEADKSFGKVAISLAETVGGATLAGAAINFPFGAAIGFVSGLLISGVSALVGYNSALKEIAYSKVFGDLSVSTEQWSQMLESSLGVTYNASEKYAELQDTLSNLKTEFDTNAEKLDFYGLKFGTMAQKISDEDAVNIKNAISDMCESTSKIIDENTQYSLEVWSNSFKQMTSLSLEEQKNILNNVVSYGEKQKSELATAQDNITKTYNNAIQSRGYLTDEEYKYISEQLQKIRDLTNKEMSKHATDIDYYTRLANDTQGHLNEESYKNFEEALNSYHNERMEAIRTQYNQEANEAKIAYENGLIDKETYDKQMTDATKRRIKSEAELDNEMFENRKKVYNNMINEYLEVSNKTDSESRKIKKIIESTFKNLNIDMSDLYGKCSNAGHEAGSRFANSYLNETQRRLESSKITVSDQNGGFVSSYNPFGMSFNRYATGGFPEDGWFRASRGEIMGKFDNGQSVVANNMQIIEGISRGVADGMIQASQYTGSSSNVDINVHTDKGFWVETVVEEIKDYIRRTGSNPFDEVF